jgi:hypothetical protein
MNGRNLPALVLATGLVGWSWWTSWPRGGLPEQPGALPAIAEQDVGAACGPLITRLSALGGEDYETAVGTAARERFTPAETAALCARLAPLADAELGPAVQRELGVPPP